VRGAGVVEPRNRAVETSIDRRQRPFRTEERRGRRGLQGGLHRRQQMPGWTYTPGYVGRTRIAFEKGNQAAAAEPGYSGW
jgi:hypothetical protein